MKKKIFAMLLAAVMLCTLLAACGGGGDNSDVQIADDGVTLQEGLPLVANPGDYEFSIFCDDSSATGEFYMLNEFEKQTNVKVDLRIMENSNAITRLNLDLNANEYADVIGGWILDDTMILKYGVQQGVFIPLEDIYEQYCPKITEILNLPGVREKMTAPDGHIYTIPYVCGDTTVGYSPYVNDEWLERVGMDMPTTTEEFEAMLQAFKDQDANGNGDPNDEIPFSADADNKHLEYMTGYFGLPMNNRALGILDGKTVFAGISPQYREFLIWFSDLYKKGLVDTEISTQDTAVWEGKGNQDMYGCCIAYGSGEFSGDTATTEKPRFSPLPVLNADNGGAWLRDTTGFSVYRTQAVITDKAAHPEIIARWFDNAFELENGIGCSTGPVGIVTFKEGDGYRKIDTSTLDKEMQEKVGWSNLWPQALPKYLPAGFTFIEDNPLYNEKKAIEEFYEPNLTKEVIDTPWVAEEDLEEYSEYSASIQNYFVENQARFIAGEQDASDDAAWKAYVDGFKALNLERFCEIRGIDTIVE